jgi:hypothetical protein
VAISSNHVALKGNNGLYVSSEGGTTTGMNCNRATYSGWKTFTWGGTTKSAIIRTNITSETPANMIYLNPCTNRLYFQNNSNANTLQLYDISGKLVFTQNLISNLNSIDIAGLKQGVYFTRISDPNKVEIVKIIKK